MYSIPPKKLETHAEGSGARSDSSVRARISRHLTRPSHRLLGARHLSSLQLQGPRRLIQALLRARRQRPAGDMTKTSGV